MVKKLRGYLKEKRKSQGLTQQNVAERLNISTQYYSLIEKGERQESLNLSMLDKLAEIFGVPLSDLITAERQFSEKAS